MRSLQKIEREHPELITPDSPTQRVGGKTREGFRKLAHSSAMLSLDNALDEAELRAFDSRVRELLAGHGFRYVAELKMDGLSMAARYRDGLFERDYARGRNYWRRRDRERPHDSLVAPVAASEDRPHRAFEVRGEVVMNRKAFERLNAEREEKGLTRFANPRNAAAGSLRAAGDRASRLRAASITTVIS